MSSGTQAPTLSDTWRTLTAAIVIQKVYDRVGIVGRTATDARQTRIQWHHEGRCIMTMTIRDMSHDFPIEVSGGNRVTAWNRTGERLNREHFGGLVASMVGQQINDEWRSWGYLNVCCQMAQAWIACGGGE
jgi:hypothetical protein